MDFRTDFGLGERTKTSGHLARDERASGRLLAHYERTFGSRRADTRLTTSGLSAKHERTFGLADTRTLSAYDERTTGQDDSVALPNAHFSVLSRSIRRCHKGSSTCITTTSEVCDRATGASESRALRPYPRRMEREDTRSPTPRALLARRQRT